MKSILSLSLLSLALSLNAAAGGSELGYLACSNGSIEKVGDRHFQVNILEDGMEFRPYESGFSVDAADVVNTHNSYAIVGKKVAVSSEGVESAAILNAMLLLSKNNRKASLAISVDKAPFQTYELSCRKMR